MILALGVVLATKIVPGIRYDDGSSLVAVVLLLSFFNAILKPLLLLFTLPFIILTMGLGVLVINALLFYFVGNLVDGFHVDRFFWSAIMGALVVSLTNVILSAFMGTGKLRGQRQQQQQAPERRAVEKKDDVIDI